MTAIYPTPPPMLHDVPVPARSQVADDGRPSPNPTVESMQIVSPVANKLRRPQTIKIVEAWHNETHPGGFRFCDQQPCHAVNWAMRGPGVPG